MSNNNEHYHNKGQEDASKGDYNPPNSGLGNVIGGWTDKEIDEIKSYKEGWRHTKDQKDD